MRYEAEPDGCGNHLHLEQRIGDGLRRAGQTASAAESLTGGVISSCLGAIEGALEDLARSVAPSSSFEDLDLG